MGIGVDIVELSRLDVENERFVRHILSDEEYVIFQSFPTKKRKRESESKSPRYWWYFIS